MAGHIHQFLLAAASALLLSSCGPEAYMMTMEMRQPSNSGIDLSGKTVSVVYLEKGAPYDTAFTYHVADGLAKRIEEDYFGGEVGVTLFKLPKDSGVYSAKDTLANLVLDTGNDVVFIVDEPTLSEGVKTDGKWTMPFGVSFYAYDSMGQTDTVMVYRGRNTLQGGSEADSQSIWKHTSDQAYNVGYSAGAKFSPQWKEESFPIVYYESEQVWVDALDDAYNFDWEKAMDKWLKLAGTKNHLKRACAEYNLAVGCFVNDEYELAAKWLELSDADGPISVSSALRKKLSAVKK